MWKGVHAQVSPRSCKCSQLVLTRVRCRDVMKRHLSKCQFKLKPIANSPDGSQPLPSTNIPQQDNPLPDGLSEPPTLHPDSSTAQSSAETQFLLPETPTSDTIWNDLDFESVQFLFDPTFLDRDEDPRLQQIAPSGFGVPCINIDPADTFHFLERISSKETASLESRYACSLYEREWASQELKNDMLEQDALITEAVTPGNPGKSSHQLNSILIFFIFSGCAIVGSQLRTTPSTRDST